MYSRKRMKSRTKKLFASVATVVSNDGNVERESVTNSASRESVILWSTGASTYPGAATRTVEEAFGGGLNCLFVPGAGGNIESLIISSRRTGPDDQFQTDYSTIERVGQQRERPIRKPQGPSEHSEDLRRSDGPFSMGCSVAAPVPGVLRRLARGS
jgi:hypothetical protein